MKKIYLILLGLTVNMLLQAQVGINTENPSTTLHVVSTKTDGSTAEGIIAPNLTRAQLISKDAKYSSTQKGAIVYVTDLSGTLTTKTANVTQIGYHYFDGTVWQPFQKNAIASKQPWLVQGGSNLATNYDDYIYMMGRVAIGTGDKSNSDYKLEVKGDSKFVGNATVKGTTDLGVTNITGKMTYYNSTTMYPPAVNKILTSLDDKGTAVWSNAQELFTQPWRIQGGTTQATKYDDNIYMMGRVAIGTGDKSNSDYKLEVKGDSKFVGNTTVKGTTDLGVTNVTGKMTYYNSTTMYPPAENKVLTSLDTDGTIIWRNAQDLVTIPTQLWQVQGGSNQATANNQNIYQTGNVAIGTGKSTTSDYKLEVKGDSKLGGALTVTSTATLNSATVKGTTDLGVTNITGKMTYYNSTTSYPPAVNKVLTSLDDKGTAGWRNAQDLVTIPTQPWLVQGGTNQATANTDNIYQTGSVAIGGKKAVVPEGFKFQVTGNSKMIGNELVTGTSKIGGTTTALNASAQLELADNNKGFLPNRVALKSATNKAPVDNADKGMFVYNTATVSAQDITPGFYYWTGDNWKRFVDQLPQVTVNMFYAPANVKGGTASGGDQSKMVSIPFSTSRSSSMI